MTDEWFEWDGEAGTYGMPARLSPASHVQVMCRNRNIAEGLASKFQWDHTALRGSDIIQYRFIEPPATKLTDTINNPSHYTNGKVEAIDAIEAATTGLEGIEAVCTGNVLKYIWRWKMKNGIEDLKKARWYVDRLIAKVEKDA